MIHVTIPNAKPFDWLDAVQKRYAVASARAAKVWPQEVSIPTDIVSALKDIPQLLATIATLMAERDKAVEHAKQARSAATDDMVGGFHRDMAGRLAEDRDVQKHRAREAEARIAELQAAVDREHGLRQTNWAYQQDLIVRLEAERDVWKTLAAKLAGLSGDQLHEIAPEPAPTAYRDLPDWIEKRQA